MELRNNISLLQLSFQFWNACPWTVRLKCEHINDNDKEVCKFIRTLQNFPPPEWYNSTNLKDLFRWLLEVVTNQHQAYLLGLRFSQWHWWTYNFLGYHVNWDIFKHNQQDVALHNGIYYYKCSTCYSRFLCPSSGAQHSTRKPVPTHSQ